MGHRSRSTPPLMEAFTSSGARAAGAAADRADAAFAESCETACITPRAVAAIKPRLHALGARVRLIVVGLSGSFLTCLAGVLANLVAEGWTPAAGWQPFAKQFIIAYSAASCVVVTLFPLLLPRLSRWLQQLACARSGRSRLPKTCA